MGDVKKHVTLEKEGSATIIEKKSEFIGYAKPVKSEEEAIEYIRQIRKKHADARHNVYGYVVGNTTRYSDDGEPQGTAGMPVLDVIRKTGFTDAVIVVTRYFGGILLGTGGLVRAYSAAAKAAAEAAHIVTYEQYDEVCFTCTYGNYPKIEKELSFYPVIIDGVDFTDTVSVCLAIKEDRTEDFSAYLQEMSAGRIELKKTGSRFDCPRNM